MDPRQQICGWLFLGVILAITFVDVFLSIREARRERQQKLDQAFQDAISQAYGWRLGTHAKLTGNAGHTRKGKPQ